MTDARIESCRQKVLELNEIFNELAQDGVEVRLDTEILGFQSISPEIKTTRVRLTAEFLKRL